MLFDAVRKMAAPKAIGMSYQNDIYLSFHYLQGRDVPEKEMSSATSPDFVGEIGKGTLNHNIST